MSESPLFIWLACFGYAPALSAANLRRGVRVSLSGHQSPVMGKDEWLTPPEILAALGAFDLDPCAPVVRPWNMAAAHYTAADDGLARPWAGRVWCNPPFGREAVKWLRRMVRHGNGIALIPARTETEMFYECVWGAAEAVCFLKGRPHFHHVSGERAPFNSGAPICLVASGRANFYALLGSGLGFVVDAKSKEHGMVSSGERSGSAAAPEQNEKDPSVEARKP
jgi:hypothetical protein